jgi:hypothetical protein
MKITKEIGPPTGLRRLLFRLPLHLYHVRLGWLLGDRLMLLRDGQAFEGFVCRIADRPEGTARAGDVLLSNLPGRTVLIRVQRQPT